MLVTPGWLQGTKLLLQKLIKIKPKNYHIFHIVNDILLYVVTADSKCRSSAQILSSPKLQILCWSLKCQSIECQSPDQNVVAQTPCYQCCWFQIYCQKGRMGLSFFFKLKRAKLISNNRYSLWTIAHTGKKCSR